MARREDKRRTDGAPPRRADDTDALSQIGSGRGARIRDRRPAVTLRDKAGIHSYTLERIC